MSNKNIILVISIFLVVLGLIKYQFNAFDHGVLSSKKEIQSSEKILGASTSQLDITLQDGDAATYTDFSPLIFGGSNPRISNNEVWNQLETSGMTFMRVPLFVEHSVPRSSVADFKKNSNGIQSINNWNSSVVDKQSGLLKKAHEHGMKTMAVLEFSPAWLSHNGTEFGVPTDWEIYRKIVSELYKKNRNNIDFIEIWNEPDWDRFLNTRNSGLSREDAYILIFRNAAEAIRSVDIEVNDGKYAQIGGPALSKISNTTILQKLLSNSELSTYLNFVSLHNYSNHSELDISKIQMILSASTASKLPIIISEWNFSSDSAATSSELYSDESISYTAGQLIKMMSQGVYGANFFAIQPYEKPVPSLGHGHLSFFRSSSSAGTTLLPMAKSWRLMSKVLNLNMGTNKAGKLISGDGYQIMLVENSENEKMILANNLNPETKIINIEIYGIKSTSLHKVEAHIASTTTEPDDIAGQLFILPSNEKLKFRLLLTGNSAAGLRIQNGIQAIID